MSSLRLFLLGPPRVERGGVVLKFRYRKHLALLAYLAVAGPSPGGESHTRESLMTLLWPELEPSRARAVLRRDLSLLRKALDGEWLVVDGETLGLDPGADVWVDVDQFRQHLAACRTHDHPPTEVCPDCLPLLEEAVGLYRGDFLAGFTLPDSAAFDEWQFFQTEGLKDELAGALVRLATYHTSQGDHDAAISYARRWQALDPLHEPAHRHLMVLYAKSGQRSAALRQYETCRQLLAGELGVEPSERTQETHGRLLKGELPVGPSAVEAILERELRTVGECPYRGLAPFREADAPFFFGREEFTARLAQAVRTQPLVVVIVGSSGSGKSSAVFAGLLPRLREEGDWLIAGLRPGAQPFHALAAALLPGLEPELGETDRLIETRKLADALSAEDIPVHDVVERALEKSRGMNRLLLLVDQLEELYTLCPQPKTRQRFLDALLAAVGTVERRPDSALVLLVTMRADFMGQALAYRPFVDALQESSLLLGPMTREELRAAIERPAERQGAALEAGLVERLLDDVGQEPGNLPLLEFALTLLWERLDYGWMTHTAYEAIGRVAGALARYAEEVYDGLAEEERERARRIFVQLVQPGEGTEDTRRVATQAELGDENWALVQHLADKRLVVTGRDPTTGKETVEVVHEALIQRWGQLRGWMAEDRVFRTWQERVRAALGQWQATGQDEGALLRGVPLAEAEGWLAERDAELSVSEKAFIQSSVELRGRQVAERERRRRRIFAGLTAGLVIALILALVAVRQRQEALVQASIGLAAQAVAELESDAPERGVLLVLETLKNYPYTPQAERALAQAVYKTHHYVTIHILDVRLLNAAFSPDGTRIATTGVEQVIGVWDSASGDPVARLNDSTQKTNEMITGVDWSPDSQILFTASSALNVARVWDVGNGDLLLTYKGHSGAVNSVHLSHDGELVLTASSDGTARIWQPDNGNTVRTLAGHEESATDAIWSPDDERVVTVSTDGTAHIWDVHTGSELRVISAHSGGVLAVAWSPDGSMIATAGNDGLGRIWDIETGDMLFSLSGHDDVVRDVEWSPDGTQLATVSADGTTRVWESATGGEVFALAGSDADINSVDWSPDGQRLVAGGGIAVRVWDVSTPIVRLVGHTGGETSIIQTNSAQWSQDSAVVLTGAHDGTARIWNSITGESLAVFEHKEPGTDMSITMHPSRSEVIVPKPLRIWNYETGQVRPLTEDDYDYGLYSPDGRLIFLLSLTPEYGIYDAETDKVIRSSVLDGCDFPFPIAWSPDSQYIAHPCLAGELKAILVTNALTGETVREFDGHTDGTTGVAWSPDGTQLASASADQTVLIWDFESGDTLQTFTGHTATVFDVEWSPNGTRLVSGDVAGNVRIWEAASGQEVNHYNVGGSILFLSWSPDGTRVLVTGLFRAPEIRPVWQSTEDLIAYAKECCVFRELTLEERELFGLGPR